MITTPMPPLMSNGKALDPAPEALGEFRDSSALRFDSAALCSRMDEDGYVLMRRLLSRDAVLRARRETLSRLSAAGHIEPGTELIDAVAAKDSRSRSQHDLAKDSQPLHDLLYTGAMIDFFTDFIGEPVRHYDFTWLRAIAPGLGTPPHSDVVYMGRGERDRLFTAWTPLGDITYAMGGLLLLEGSHKLENLKEGYWNSDVDTYCVNRPGIASHDRFGPGRSRGWLGQNPPLLRNSLGGLRWLTAEFNAGDVLIFNTFTVHGSLDNASDRLRISCDSRYQPASKPADERWIGLAPIGHTLAGKRGKIC